MCGIKTEPLRVFVLLAALFVPSVSSLAVGLEAVARPSYQFLRHQEDWSVLAGSAINANSDSYDHIKYVALNNNGTRWVSFGGHLRLRSESWRDFSFGAPRQHDDSFLLSRLALHSDLHVNDKVRVFAEIKSALATNRDLPGGKRSLDVDTLALQQAFLDLRFAASDHLSVTLRPGRQALLFGKQRLVSPLPWGNSLRTWDGISSIFEFDKVSVTAFWTQFVPVKQYQFNKADSGNEFFGVYGSGASGAGSLSYDFYWLSLDRESAVFNGTEGNERRNTFGGRIEGAISNTGVNFDLELAYQTGEVGTAGISAYMIASQISYQVPSWKGKPRFSLGYDYASGDKSASGDVETFNQLFPLGHAYLGYIDIVGRQNIVDVSPGVLFVAAERLKLAINGHLFRRAEAADALYNAGGGVVRAGSAGSSRDVGSEVDLVFSYQYDRHLHGLLGYSHFFAGDFIAESGASEDIDFVYLQLQHTF